MFDDGEMKNQFLPFHHDTCLGVINEVKSLLAAELAV